MKITEIIAGVIFFIGLIFKYLVFPGATVLISSSLLLLVYYYFFFGFAVFTKIKLLKIFKSEEYKGLKPIEIILAILLGISLSTFINGTLSELLDWYNHYNLFTVGFVLTLTVLVLYLAVLKKEIKNWKIIFIRSFIILSIGGIVYLIF